MPVSAALVMAEPGLYGTIPCTECRQVEVSFDGIHTLCEACWEGKPRREAHVTMTKAERVDCKKTVHTLQGNGKWRRDPCNLPLPCPLHTPDRAKGQRAQ